MKNWILEFFLKAMAPYVSGPLSKPLKLAVRNTADYEFTTNSISDDENDAEDMDDARSSENKASIKGIRMLK